MATFSPSTFLLLLLALLASTFLSSADTQLIDNTCKSTVNYGACIHCIYSFRGSDKADIHQLSIHATECGISGADILSMSFGALGRNPSETPMLRKVYSDCEYDFSQAKYKFKLAENSLNSKDYGSAIRSVKEVVDLIEFCKTEIENSGNSGSVKKVGEDLRVFTDICSIADTIIHLSIGH